jgi:hypothetical protein
MSVSLDGGVPVTLGTDTGCALSVSVDATNLYWTTEDGALKDHFALVRRTPLAGGSTVVLSNTTITESLAALPLPIAPGETAASVYWTGSCKAYSSQGVCRTGEDGGALTVMIAEAAYPVGIAWTRRVSTGLRRRQRCGRPTARLASCPAEFDGSRPGRRRDLPKVPMLRAMGIPAGARRSDARTALSPDRVHAHATSSAHPNEDRSPWVPKTRASMRCSRS